MRAFKFKDQNVYFMGSDSSTFLCIRVLLEYCVWLGTSHFKRFIKILERNQRKFSETVKGKRKPTGTGFLFSTWQYGCWGLCDMGTVVTNLWMRSLKHRIEGSCPEMNDLQRAKLRLEFRAGRCLNQIYFLLQKNHPNLLRTQALSLRISSISLWKRTQTRIGFPETRSEAFGAVS